MASPAAGRLRTRPSADLIASRRTARIVGLAGFLVAAALPIVLWGESMLDVAHRSTLEPSYFLSGWLPYGLIGVGLLLLVPVLVSIGRDTHSRLYPRRRNALAGWGISCYLLGFALATQVAQIAGAVGAH